MRGLWPRLCTEALRKHVHGHQGPWWEAACWGMLVEGTFQGHSRGEGVAQGGCVDP